MTKVVFFAFNAEPVCFMHAILNAIDLEEKGMWGEIVFEGKSTDLIPLISQPDHFINPLYVQAKERGMFYGACLSCSNKMNVTDIVEAENIPFADAVSMNMFCEPAYGVIDYEALRDVLQEVNYSGWAIVEQDMYPAPPDKPLPIAKRTRAYLRELGIG